MEGRLLKELIEAALCGENSGVTVWSDTRPFPVPPQPQNGNYKQRSCQSRQTWPVCSEPDPSFEAGDSPSLKGISGGPTHLAPYAIKF